MQAKSFHSDDDFIYRAKVLDHYRNPRNFGKLKNHTHEAGFKNASCGDAVYLQAKIEKGKIVAIGFTGSGCAISVAATSLVTDYAKNKSLVALKKLELKDIEKLLGIPISSAREKCAMMGVETLKQLN